VAIEVQALVASPKNLSKDAPPGQRRRVADGLERDRLEVCAAVLERQSEVALGSRDLFARVAGGFTANEPAIDLPLALALASSAMGVPVPADLVAIGEVGLSGDVRSVPGLALRLRECARLGFRTAVAGRSAAGILGKEELRVVAIAHLSDAVRLLAK